MSEHLQIAILGAGGLSGLELLTWLRDIRMLTCVMSHPNATTVCPLVGYYPLIKVPL